MEVDIEAKIALTDAMKGRGDMSGMKAPTTASNPNLTHSLTSLTSSLAVEGSEVAQGFNDWYP